MNIYLYELRSLRKSTIIWTCSLVALTAFFFSVYPAVASDAEDFRKMLMSYPAAVRSMLGITLDGISGIVGFYSMIFSFTILCAAVQAMNYGLSILSKETRERTADFLLVKPVSRSAIVGAKLLAAITMLFATNIIFSGAAVIIANMVRTTEYNGKQYFMINATLFFVQLILFSLGAVVSVIIPKLKSVLPVSLGIVFGLYLIGALLATGKDDWARFLSPFRYFDIQYVMKNSSYEARYLVLGALITIVCVSASFVIYARKDIHAVS